MKTGTEQTEIVEDIISVCKKYKLNITTVVDCVNNDPDILEKLQRQDDPFEQVFGSLWDLVQDCLLPNIRLSMAEKKRPFGRA